MNTNWKEVARATLEGSESGTTTFAQNVKDLIAAGFDGYSVDFRRNIRTYYMPNGDTLELKTAHNEPVTERFDAEVIKQGLQEAKDQVPGYTYRSFCTKVVNAGCAGYYVSFLGKRVLYYGRTGETYTEYFPGTRPGAKS